MSKARKPLSARVWEEVKPFFPGRPPSTAIYLAVMLVVASWLPLAIIARSRVSKSELPRIHPIQDMDNQPKFKTQSWNELFADGRASRPKVPGTVAVGRLEADDHYYRGFERVWNAQTNQHETRFFDTFPRQIEISHDFLRRGQQLYNIHCAACHGKDGLGRGTVHIRAEGAANPGWVPPSNLHDQGPRERNVGHVYNTVVNGIRNMKGYGHSIQRPDDRWAVVAYVRALQLSGKVPAELLDRDTRNRLTGQPQDAPTAQLP